MKNPVQISVFNSNSMYQIWWSFRDYVYSKMVGEQPASIIKCIAKLKLIISKDPGLDLEYWNLVNQELKKYNAICNDKRTIIFDSEKDPTFFVLTWS